MTTDVGTRTVEAAASARRFSLAGIAVTVTLAIGIFAPILYYMVLHWKAVPDYSHGFLVGPLALYFAWERRAKLRRAPIESSWWGVLPLALGSLALVIGRLGVELMAMRTAFVLTLIGLVLLLLGLLLLLRSLRERRATAMAADAASPLPSKPAVAGNVDAITGFHVTASPRGA